MPLAAPLPWTLPIITWRPKVRQGQMGLPLTSHSAYLSRPPRQGPDLDSGHPRMRRDRVTRERSWVMLEQSSQEKP